MKRLFLNIYDCLSKRRRAYLILLPLLMSIIFLFAARRISPNTDISKFLPYDSADSVGSVIYKHLRSQDRIVVFLRGKSVDSLSIVADEFVDMFESADIKGVSDKQFVIDPSQFLYRAGFAVENLPLFLAERDYSYLDSIASLPESALYEIIRQDKEQLLSPLGVATDNFIASDPFHFASPLLSRFSAEALMSNFQPIGDYLFTKDSSSLVCSFILDSKEENSQSSQALLSLNDILSNIQEEYPDVEVSAVGSQIVAASNAERMKRDSMRCALIAISFIIILLWWYFKRLRKILLISIPVFWGILFALALMGLFNSTLSAIALSACSVIFGIGVDYALIYLSRYEFVGNSRETLSDVASPMVIGNITTVGAFLSLVIMSAEGMRDFGIFSALSLVGTIFFVMVFLPHYVERRGSKSGASGAVNSQNNKESNLLYKIASFKIENIRYITYILLFATITLYIFGRKVGFDGDFNSINYLTDNQRKDLQVISAAGEGDNMTLYALSKGCDLDEALIQDSKYENRFSLLKDSALIIDYLSLSQFLPSTKDVAERVGRWNLWRDKYREKLEGVLRKSQIDYGFSPNAFDGFYNLMDREFDSSSKVDYSPFVDGWLDNYIIDNEQDAYILSKLLVPKENLNKLYADHSAEIAFFDSVSMTKSMIDILQKDFNRLLFICSILVFVFLCFAFKRLELALLAFIPMAISWIWIVGLMGIFGMNFNIVSVILATFIFGLGDDYTIFMVEALQEEYETKKALLSSYKTGVVLSSLTMFIGVGALSFATHPALKSLGIVAIIGMLCVVLMAFAVPPLLFRFYTTTKYKGERIDRVAPVKITDILLTIYSFAAFLIASIWFRVRSLFHLRESNQKFRSRLKNTMNFFSNNIPRVDSNIEYIGSDSSTFDTPSVIICNHQSHLDLMYIIGLSEKITLLTNKWVYHSPIYSDIVKRAGFISLEDGIDENMDKIEQAVREGYSIVVFPEGTRSLNGDILPFKSGAFHIAQTLKLDIQPIFIDGLDRVFRKGEFVLRKGKVDIKIMPRINYSELENYGSRPLKIAQSFNKLYKSYKSSQ